MEVDDEHQQQDNDGGHEEQADEGPPHPHGIGDGRIITASTTPTGLVAA